MMQVMESQREAASYARAPSEVCTPTEAKGRANHSTRDIEPEAPPADAPPAWDVEPDEDDEAPI